MPGWRWIHTPGHAPGHISLWREVGPDADRRRCVHHDRAGVGLCGGDQRPEMHGPPMYFTPDWGSAKTSVGALAALEPEIAVTGHGRAMRGAEMRAALHALARDFDRVAVPDTGNTC